MPIPNHSFHVTLTPSGVINSDYPNGVIPSVPMSWATIPSFLNNQAGTPFSVNVRTGYLTEPGSPNATLSIVGTPPAGWSMVGDSLSYSGTGVGIAAIQIQAARLGVNVLSNIFTIQSIALAAADTQPPSNVTGLIATALAGPTVQLTWDAASDIAVPGITSSLMKNYDLKNGSDTLITTVSSLPGISIQLNSGSIGPPTPDISAYSQSAGDYTFTVGGDATNLFGTTDTLGFVNAPLISGNFTIIGQADFVTGSANAFAKFGLMIRGSLGATDVFVNLVKFADSTSNGVNMEWRGVAGGACSQATRTPGINGRTYLKLTRAGSVFTGYYWNGVTWVQQGTVTIGMNTAVYVGVSANSGVSGATITGTMHQINIQNLAQPTYTDSSVAVGNTYSYQVIARDLALNVAPSAATVSITLSAPAASGAFPIAAMRSLGSPQTAFASAAFQNVACKYDYCTLTYYPGIEQNMGVSMATIYSSIKTKSAALGRNVQMGMYFMSQEFIQSTSSPYAGLNVLINAGNNNLGWCLRNPYPAGAKVVQETIYYCANETNAAPTYNIATVGSVAGPGTVNYAQFSAWYRYQLNILGKGVEMGDPASVACAANPYIDYIEEDNQFMTPRSVGSWLSTSTVYNPYTNLSDRALIAPRLQQGHAQKVAAWNALTSVRNGGNCDHADYYPSAIIDPSNVGLYQHPHWEGVIGQSFSFENFHPFTDVLNAATTVHEKLVAPGGVWFFNQQGRDATHQWNAAQSTWVAADWQAARYGFEDAQLAQRDVHGSAGHDHKIG